MFMSSTNLKSNSGVQCTTANLQKSRNLMLIQSVFPHTLEAPFLLRAKTNLSPSTIQAQWRILSRHSKQNETQSQSKLKLPIVKTQSTTPWSITNEAFSTTSQKSTRKKSFKKSTSKATPNSSQQLSHSNLKTSLNSTSSKPKSSSKNAKFSIANPETASSTWPTLTTDTPTAQTDSQQPMTLCPPWTDHPRTTRSSARSTTKAQRAAGSPARREVEEAQVRIRLGTRWRDSLYRLRVKGSLKAVDQVTDQKAIRNQVREKGKEVVRNLKGWSI